MNSKFTPSLSAVRIAIILYIIKWFPIIRVQYESGISKDRIGSGIYIVLSWWDGSNVRYLNILYVTTSGIEFTFNSFVCLIVLDKTNFQVICKRNLWIFGLVRLFSSNL